MYHDKLIAIWFVHFSDKVVVTRWRPPTLAGIRPKWLISILSIHIFYGPFSNCHSNHRWCLLFVFFLLFCQDINETYDIHVFTSPWRASQTAPNSNVLCRLETRTPLMPFDVWRKNNNSAGFDWFPLTLIKMNGEKSACIFNWDVYHEQMRKR